ncbi:heparinase II/III-family protein (plasmid) [Rhizobium sp. 32-5/1]|uniref:heparinase II/III family protein n=1 Tax=Rhizobium sp. 32-5/1 TaxID=3019602 RepID=UPI00240D59DC|nr:heparinase II/III-family protein [Rhizobium sp. 32-5/1]WEZ85858.1 heparinase II/III-family protein [Rhizobium sp. 32-5/1]
MAYPSSVSSAISGYVRAPMQGPRPPQAELRDALLQAPVTGAPLPYGLKTFADGGYTVIREAREGHDVHIIMDHAPLGYLSIAAHGHADALSLVVTVDGKPLFIDPGTYLYHSGGAWRDWFRSTRAHNTLALAGSDQSIMSGAFNWSHKAAATLELIEEGRNWRIVASHDGYQKRFGCLHRRTVTADPCGFSIADALVGDNDQMAEVCFQLAPGAVVEIETRRANIYYDRQLLAQLSFSHMGEVRSLLGGPPGSGGWFSGSFGTKLPAPRIVWSGKLPLHGLVTRVELVGGTPVARQAQ